MKRRWLPVAGALAAVITVAGAGAAQAANSPGSVTSSATVGSTITLTLSAASVNFGTVNAGDADDPGSALSATVTTNDGHGFILAASPADMTGNGPDVIPLTNMSVMTADYAPQTWPAESTGYQPVDAKTAGGTYNLFQSWQLSVPGATPADYYTGVISYLATAS